MNDIEKALDDYMNSEKAWYEVYGKIMDSFTEKSIKKAFIAGVKKGLVLSI